MTTLPERNPVVLAIYALLMLSMFGIIAWLVIPYTEEGQPLFPSSSADHTPQTLAIQPGEVMTIIGFGARLDLSREVEPQIEQLWQQLNTRNLASELQPQQPLNFYLAYHSYSPTNNSVAVVLGYPSQHTGYPPTGLAQISIIGERYITLHNSSVLDGWLKADSLKQRLKYSADFEIYQLDRDYNVQTMTAYLSIAE